MAELPVDWVDKVVTVVRLTRRHPDIRVGSSVRGALDTVVVARALGELRRRPPTDARVGLDAALAALSGRIRLHEGAPRSAEEIVTALWEQVFGPVGGAGPAEGHGADDGAEDDDSGGAGGDPDSGKAQAPPG